MPTSLKRNQRIPLLRFRGESNGLADAGSGWTFTQEDVAVADSSVDFHQSSASRPLDSPKRSG